MTDVVAVDWSGARTGEGRRLWLAHVRDGQMLELTSGRTRRQVIDHLIELKAACPEHLAVGLDFSFSLPAWFLHQRGLRSAADLWREVAEHGETWLHDCQPPFWGKKGDRRPELEEHLRRTERVATIGGIAAKSTFQIRGAGTVGTGSLRGMPYLLDLQRAGFCIAPFDPPSCHTVVEVYPRLMTGPVHKRNLADRAAYLERSRWTLSPGQRALAASSEDAFDAAITALVMDEHANELRRVRPTDDPDLRLEGWMWAPNNIEA
ncbi:MAG TPA: DUF429 domain-containing protein [Acidimicrobiales bacterium]|jgi:hypothetical protein